MSKNFDNKKVVEAIEKMLLCPASEECLNDALSDLEPNEVIVAMIEAYEMCIDENLKLTLRDSMEKIWLISEAVDFAIDYALNSSFDKEILVA